MLSGTLVIEEYGWGIEDVMYDVIDVETGEPTGQQEHRKVLLIQTLDMDRKPGPRIEIRMSQEHFDTLADGLAQGKTPLIEQVPAAALDALPSPEAMLRRRTNGGD